MVAAAAVACAGHPQEWAAEELAAVVDGVLWVVDQTMEEAVAVTAVIDQVAAAVTEVVETITIGLHRIVVAMVATWAVMVV